ncbi:MAG: hypothetical protein LAT67_00405 [Balneolales bacterium]|nr:hypothetical protein [Balneolales bacterium]
MGRIASYWWQRDNLQYKKKELHCSGKNLSERVDLFDLPCYLYDFDRVKENISRITRFGQMGHTSFYLLYAMKANRFNPLLKTIALDTSCGIDACSPSELELAVVCGFTRDRISVTSTGVSHKDFEGYSQFNGIMFNCDSISALKKIKAGRYFSNTGLRLNPARGVGYNDNPLVHYSGSKATKFGIYKDRLEEAADYAKKSDIAITGLHMHAGSGFLNTSLDAYRENLRFLRSACSLFPNIEYLNIGGGLGIPLTKTDEKLDLEMWSRVVSEELGDLPFRIYAEPGDHIVKDAGILLAQVVEVEEKGGTTFVTVNAGFNVHPEPAFYKLPLEPVPVRLDDEKLPQKKVTIAGNINEALDIFNEDQQLEVKEGEIIAFLNAGAYGASMASAHCLRGKASELQL